MYCPRRLPFSTENEFFLLHLGDPGLPAVSSASNKSLQLPAYYIDEARNVRVISHDEPSDLRDYMKRDLDVSRLNVIINFLWLAGFPHNVRALHHQHTIGREIVVTERADLHLLCQEKRFFLKPLPNYVLSHGVWNSILCKDAAAYEAAMGFLLSYIRLLRHKTDVKIAHDTGLLDRGVSWEDWTSFTAAVLSSIDASKPSNISARYLYGELRLSRINMIYRLYRKTTGLTVFIRGYEYGHRSYVSFTEDNFAWMLTAFIYLTVCLAAMQVGLSTNELSHSKLFQRLSYAFTSLALSALVTVLGVIGIVSTVLVFFNVLYALKKKREAFGNIIC